MKIVADASALLAILLAEPDGDQYLSKLLIADAVWISPVNWWEVQVRMRTRYGQTGEAVAAKWMTEVGIVVEAVTLHHAEIALAAFARYRGRPARLNMGDCFAYALARDKDAPLLYKGDDFARTDVRPI
jgi:ribonuclease VapC